MKILTIIGARPQFIKAAAVSRQSAKAPEIREIIVHTGQHFDHNMSDVFFEEMQIPKPDYHLDIHSLSHGAMTGRMLEEIEKVLIKEQPDYALVYGDTNSTIAGALAARKLHIKVIHVEAGLRSYNMKMPEEINRILTDRISDILFCPTETAIQNLKKEGFNQFDCEIYNSGDVMEDAALFYASLAKEKSSIVEDLNLNGFILCTFHREENTDDPEKLSQIVDALNSLSKECQVVIPLHPRTEKALDRFHLKLDAKVIPSVGYFDMINLIQHSNLVLTDSGGLQKEAYFFNTFCLTMREQTEWRELVEHDYNRIVGTSKVRILDGVEYFLKKSFVKNSSFYGGGKAAETIVNHLLSKS